MNLDFINYILKSYLHIFGFSAKLILASLPISIAFILSLVLHYSRTNGFKDNKNVPYSSSILKKKPPNTEQILVSVFKDLLICFFKIEFRDRKC